MWSLLYSIDLIITHIEPMTFTIANMSCFLLFFSTRTAPHTHTQHNRKKMQRRIIECHAHEPTHTQTYTIKHMVLGTFVVRLKRHIVSFQLMTQVDSYYMSPIRCRFSPSLCFFLPPSLSFSLTPSLPVVFPSINQV